MPAPEEFAEQCTQVSAYGIWRGIFLVFLLMCGCTTGKWQTYWTPERQANVAYYSNQLVRNLGNAVGDYARGYSQGYYNSEAGWNDWEQFRTYQTVRQIRDQQILDRMAP